MAMAKSAKSIPTSSISQQTLLLRKEIDAWAYTRGQVCALGVYGPKNCDVQHRQEAVVEPYYEHLILTYDLWRPREAV